MTPAEIDALLLLEHTVREMRKHLARKHTCYGHGDYGQDWALDDYMGEGSKLVDQLDFALGNLDHCRDQDD